jgi:hypothetical protein
VTGSIGDLVNNAHTLQAISSCGFEEEHINASYTDGQQSQDRTN